MSTPTDPYSRPDREDGHDDILDPLPEEREERNIAEPSDTPAHEAPADAPVNNDEALTPPPSDDSPAFRNASRFDSEPAQNQPTQDGPIPSNPHEGEASVADDPEFTESETESTRSWTPSFDDDVDEPAGAKPSEDNLTRETPEDRAAARERWEREFGNVDTTPRSEDDTVIAGNDPATDATAVRSPAATDQTVMTPPVAAPAGANYPNRTSVFNRVGVENVGSSPSTIATPPETVSPRHDTNGFRFQEPIPEEPRGRGWAHVGVFFATLIVAPLAWYLVADSGVRLVGLEDSAWNTGTVDWLVVLELLGALLCLAVLWYLASFSSVGAIVIGLIIAIAGAIAIFAPAFAQDLLTGSAMRNFSEISDFTGNVAYHLTNDAASGRLTVYGFVLFMTGIVSHSARRFGTDRGDVTGRRAVLLSRNPNS